MIAAALSGPSDARPAVDIRISDVFTFFLPEAREAVLRNPHAEVQDVAGTGHAPHRDRPDLVEAALREWLERTT